MARKSSEPVEAADTDGSKPAPMQKLIRKVQCPKCKHQWTTRINLGDYGRAKCVVCSKSFRKQHKNQKICGRARCKERARRAINKKYKENLKKQELRFEIMQELRAEGWSDPRSQESSAARNVDTPGAQSSGSVRKSGDTV